MAGDVVNIKVCTPSNILVTLRESWSIPYQSKKGAGTFRVKQI